MESGKVEMDFLASVLLLSMAAICFGFYGGIRKHMAPNIDSISFAVLYVTFQFLFSLLVYFCLGLPVDENVSTVKVIYVGIGGMVVLVAEYLYLAVVENLNASTAMSCLSVEYAVGITLDYIISNDGIHLPFLILGSILGLCGLLSLVLADHLKFSSKEEKERLTEGNDYIEWASSEPQTNTSKSFLFWVLTGCFAGVLCSCWSIMPALGESGDDGLTDPGLIFFVFQSGQLIALPFVIFVFGYLDLLGVIDRKVTSVSSIVATLRETPRRDVMWSIFIGIIVSGGYGGYFYGSSGDVPVAVSYALMMNVVLVSTISSIVVFREFRGVPYCSRSMLFIFLGIIFYIAAMCIFLILTF